MNKFLKASKWLLKACGQTYAALLVGGLAVGVLATTALAASLTTTPTNYAAGDVSTLNTQLLAGGTSLTVNPVSKWLNGVKTKGCFHTGSGFILIQDYLGRTEYASYNGKSCSSSFVTTLSNLTRGLSLTSPGFTGGTGLQFDASASVRVIDYPTIYSQALYRDKLNYMQNSGATVCTSTSQPCFFPTAVTTTQRNAFTFGTSSGLYPDIFNTTLSIKQYWNGSTWVNYGSGSTTNASETVRGSVQLGTVKDQTGATVTGSSGAPTVVQTRYLVGSGGLNNRGKIPTLDRTGFLSGSTLGSNPATSTTFLRGDHVWTALPASNGDMFYGNGGSGNVTIAGATNLPLNSRPTYKYNQLTINVGGTLGVTGSNGVLVVMAASGVTINGTIDLDAKGAQGGSGGVANPSAGKGGGTGRLLTGASNLSSFKSLFVLGGKGGAGDSSKRGGGGGGSYARTGSAGGGSGGAGGTPPSAQLLGMLSSIGRGVACGSGGGGGSGEGGAGGDGGQGGGCMVMFVGGNLNLGASSIIRARGNAGEAGIANVNAGSGGGGGGGGNIFIIVAGTITDLGVTLQASGGAAGAGGASNGGAGGAGADGSIIIYSLATGQIITI